MQLRTRCLIAAVIGVVLLVPVLPASSSDAAQVGIVSANPADNTPDVISSGGVRYLAQAGNTMVAGGNFTQVRNPSNGTVYNRANLFSFDLNTGLVNPGFAPTFDGMVHSLVISPDGQQVFVGGEFKTVNGVTSLGLVALNLSNGSISSTFHPPKLDGRVFSMRLSRGKLYIAGGFTRVGSAPIAYLAALDATTGALDASTTATFSGVNHPTTNPGTTVLVKIDISPDGSRLVAVGNFATVNGLDRPQIVLLNLDASPPSVIDWITDRYRAPCLTSYQTYMHDAEFSPDGSYFVVVTTGGAYGGGGGTVVGCDSAARWQTSARGTSLQPSWITHTGNDTLWSTAVTEDAVYTGGHNRWQNNAYGSDVAGAGAVSRPGLAALDPLTGVPFDWNPGRTTGVGVFDMLATDTGLWIGHDTNLVGGEARYKVGFFPLAGGKSIPAVSAGSLPGAIYQLGGAVRATDAIGSCGGSTLGNSLDTIQRRLINPSASPVAGLAAPLAGTGRAWSQVRGAFMLSGTLYTGWPNGQFCAQAFDGTTFGPATPVEQYNNKFIAELPTVTSMFFANNRIYYTKSGSNTLWYRYFVPQSQILGAVAYSAGGNVMGINYSQVNGMTLSGDYLYFGARNDNALHRIGWNGSAPVAGTGSVISSVAMDGASWANSSFFLYSPAGAAQPNVPPQASISTQCMGLTCAFSSAGSGDPDGVLTSYDWDFGDGTTATGNAATHTYTNEGTFTATLTVTDANGERASASQPVTVGVPKLPPVASFTASCAQLTCSVNGNASSDADGQLSGFNWDFGDGTGSTDAATQHTFATGGPYTIKLTVTDNDSLTGTASQLVNVAAAPTNISFVGERHVNANASQWTLSVPGNVVAGDGLVLVATTTATSLSNPSGAGWSLVGTRTVSGATTKVWQKVAGASDAGASVQLTAPGTVKTVVDLLAYHGTATTPVSAFASAAETVSRTVHTTPSVASPPVGSWALSLWTDKSSVTTTLTPAVEQTTRYSACGTLAGHTCLAVADSGAPVASPTAGGVIATADLASAAASMWTILLAPAG